MPPFTEAEQKLLALALFGYAMRAGPGQFTAIEALVTKLGITTEYQSYANDWLTTALESIPTVPNKSAEVTIKLAIYLGIFLQRHQMEDPNFATILKDSIYREVFVNNRLKWALKELYIKNLDPNDE